ncbi:hypothetical protein Gasu_01900 isoform 1 [Galdieria sulphuraria]|uniref:Uncharacterized protein n=1 Tax=Galdieria sulphuraria TaxID=130081 RepID=M2Y9V1_GALSU|nr:hypothetical protein Gasu_01900 isoform 1 [Galdieria sulphuraria]EME32833.1 hypothetical protein Gasu_01900 isoform 1 [Galdieria sulphuraria]|eukprot:XP_005709353.1 hypothetical protein isoform 1 [Galdieria sulphuraria]
MDKSSYQLKCTMFIMAVPFGEKASVISHLTCEIFPDSFQDAVESCPCVLQQPQIRFNYSSQDTKECLASFMDLPFSKAVLCGKSLSSSIGKSNYIWYSCALEVEQNRRKSVYQNLTAGIHYRGMFTQGWIVSAQRVVSLVARSIALEELRCSYVTRQSTLPSGQRELENILKSALTCVVCEIPGKIVVNNYLEMYIQRQYLSENYDWKEYSLCFYISSEQFINEMFHFPYTKILSLLFRLWDPTKCLIDTVRECLVDFDKIFIIDAIQKGRAYHVTEYVQVLKKNIQFTIYDTAKNRMEGLWSKISKIQEMLYVGSPLTTE